MVEAYGYKQQIINELNNIDNDTNNFYNYKGLNFLSKLSSKNKNLVINFHGSVSGKGIDRVIFRGYNYNIYNTDIICISDFLLNKYHHYHINWALSTKKYNIDNLYKDLFKYLINTKNYKSIIFTGSSAGGYQSIKYACYFNCIALISNCQIYLENYNLFERTQDTINTTSVSLKSLIKMNNDEVIYGDRNIEKHFYENKPQKIIIYCNKLDYTYKDHIKPFINFVNDNNLMNLLDITLFEKEIEGIRPHNIQYPDDKKHIDILQEFIQTIKNIFIL